MALPVLLLLFVVVPIAELAVIIAVGREIGVWWTVLILIADSIIGSLLLRSQGRVVWRRFTEALQAGRPPAREVVDGVLVLAGGIVLLTPGFLSDLMGVFLLLPPTRAVIRRIVLKRVGKRITASVMTAAASPRRPSQHFDIEGRAIDVEPRP